MARLGDKRHLIGVQTAKLIDTFFSTVEYTDKPNKIAKYANYAIEDNGPASYEEPAPRGLVHGVPGYTVGYLLFSSPLTLLIVFADLHGAIPQPILPCPPQHVHKVDREVQRGIW
jgi:hypothetical protein